MSRIEPAGPPQAYKSYLVLAPLRTHHEPASCAAAGCDGHRHGFVTTVDEATALGQRQAQFIRRLAGRRYFEERTPAGLTAFTFPAGQECFTSPCECSPGRPHRHHRRLDREERFAVTGGDHRGNPAGVRPAVLSPASWVDDFGEHQEKLADTLERG